eukprot:scaffold40512_cov59-Attheya_sp.AAC.5
MSRKNSSTGHENLKWHRRQEGRVVQTEKQGRAGESQTTIISFSGLQIIRFDPREGVLSQSNHASLEKWMCKSPRSNNQEVVEKLDEKLKKNEILHVFHNHQSVERSVLQQLCLGRNLALIANLDTMQQSEEKAYAANFGCSVRSQGKIGSPMIQEAIWGTETPKLTLEHTKCLLLTLFNDLHTSVTISKLFTRNGKSLINQTIGTNQELMGKSPYPYPQMTLIPLAAPNPNLKNACVDTKWANHEKMLTATCWESAHRALSEFVVMHVFGQLPYATMGHIAVDNASKYFAANPKECLKLPILKCARPLRKGACGIYLEKPLRDGGNDALTYGLWTCVTKNVKCIDKENSNSWVCKLAKENAELPRQMYRYL